MKTKKQFYAFLKEEGMYKEYKRRTKEGFNSVKHYLEYASPETWIISAFEWPLDDFYIWKTLHVEWNEEINNTKD